MNYSYMKESGRLEFILNSIYISVQFIFKNKKLNLSQPVITWLAAEKIQFLKICRFVPNLSEIYENDKCYTFSMFILFCFLYSAISHHYLIWRILYLENIKGKQNNSGYNVSTYLTAHSDACKIYDDHLRWKVTCLLVNHCEELQIFWHGKKQ